MATIYNTVTPDLRTAYLNNMRMTPRLVVKNISADVTWDRSTIESLSVEHTLCGSDSYSIGSIPASALTLSVLNTAGGVDSVVTGTKLRVNMGYLHNTWESAGTVTETQFNADKTHFWVLHSSENYYVRCTPSTNYSSSAAYYVVSSSEDTSYFRQGIYYVDDAETEKHTMFTTFKAYDRLYSKEFNNDLVDKRFFTSTTYKFNPEASPASNMTNLLHFYDINMRTTGLLDSGHTRINIDNTMTLREVMARIAIMGGCNIVADANRSGNERLWCLSTKDLYDSVQSDFLGYMNQTPLSTTAAPTYTVPIYHVIDFSLDGQQKTQITFLQAEVDVEDLESGNTETVTYQYPDTEVLEGEVGLSFDNSFFNDDSPLQQIFDRIATNGSYSYQGFSANIHGAPWICVNNNVSLTCYTKANTTGTYNVRPFKVTHTFNGAYSTTLSSANVTPTSDFTNSSASEKTTIAVSKLNNKIINIKKMMTGTYGECSTAAGTAAKKVYVQNFTAFDNQKVAVKFTNASTADKPTLRIYWDSALSQPATEALPIYVNTSNSEGEGFRRLKGSDVYGWKSNQVVVFTFFTDLINGEPAWLIENNLAANFIGVVDGGVLRLATQPDGEIVASGTHTDLGANYVEIVRDVATSDGVESHVDFRASDSGVVVGSDASHQVRILPSSGIRIVNNTTEMNLSDRLTLTSDRNVTYNVHNLPNNAVVLAAGFFNANQLNCTGITLYNNDSTGSDFIWEKRANGHCSLKMI